MIPWRLGQRLFTTSCTRREVLSIVDLPKRVQPTYSKSADGSSRSKLQAMRWSEHPQNVLICKKPGVESVRDALVEFAEHITHTYPGTSIILEPTVAHHLHSRLSKPVYTLPPDPSDTPFPFTLTPDPRTPASPYHSPPLLPPHPPSDDTSHQQYADPSTTPYHVHTDLVVTLGGDGTILHAASLFSTATHVPPFLSFAMGTLGFLGEFKWKDHKSAFAAATNTTTSDIRILPRRRLRAGVFTTSGTPLPGTSSSYLGISSAHAMNELSLHRGRSPHLAILEIYVGGRLLTEAVADGLIVATPTGSTAYSLSSGGSIMHPAVPCLLLTPICPRSLSFRPLVLPQDAKITVKLAEKHRGGEVEVSVDGRRWGGVGPGQEVRVWLERGEEEGKGVPCIKRVSGGGGEGEDGWVGGLNGLLKFNYPFGEEE